MSDIFWTKLKTDEATVWLNKEKCKEYTKETYPIILESGDLMVVNEDKQYAYVDNFIQDSIQFLVDHGAINPVLRTLSESLINDFAATVEEYGFYAEEAPDEWTGKELADEILDSLEGLSRKLGTTLEEIREKREYDFYWDKC